MDPVTALAIGSTLASAITGITGIGQKKRARKLRKEADRLHRNIPEVHAGTAKHLANIQKQEEFTRAGNTRAGNAMVNASQDAIAQSGANIVRSAGGSTAGVVDAMIRLQNSGQRQLNAGLSQGEAFANQLLNMQTPIYGQMADRQLRLRSYSRDTAAMRAASLQQAGNANLQGAIASIPNIAVGFGNGAGGTGSPRSAQASGMQTSSAVSPLPQRSNMDMWDRRSGSDLNQYLGMPVPVDYYK